MIGPGWMPSRPRPIGRMRRGLFSYTSGCRRSRRVRSNRLRSAAQQGSRSPCGEGLLCGGLRITRDLATLNCNTDVMLFDGAHAELPTAMLLTSASQPRHRVLAGHLHHWLADRWTWLRPRTVPMIVAFAGMLAVLGTVKYLAVYSRGDVTPSQVGRIATPNAPSYEVWNPDRAPRAQGLANLEPPELIELTIKQPARQ